jgi:hypothetical protein
MVRRIDRALPGSRTLRMLIELKNPTRKSIRKYVSFHTDLGSDDDTRIRASSSGDLTFNRRDRWGITVDSTDDSPSDPAVTIVTYGKGKVVRPSFQLGPQRGGEVVVITFRVTIGPRETRFLLLFTELADTVAAAKSSAGKFNKQRLNKALLAGLSPKVRKNSLNWDLG